jgi:hypothetical protein
MLTTTLADLQASLPKDDYERIAQRVRTPESWGQVSIPLNALLPSHRCDKWDKYVLEIREAVRVLAALGHSDLMHEWLRDCIKYASNIVINHAVSIEDVIRYVQDSGDSGPKAEFRATLNFMIAVDRLMAWDHDAAISHAMNAVHAMGGTPYARVFPGHHDRRFAEWCVMRLGAYLDEEVDR